MAQSTGAIDNWYVLLENYWSILEGDSLSVLTNMSSLMFTLLSFSDLSRLRCLDLEIQSLI